MNNVCYGLIRTRDSSCSEHHFYKEEGTVFLMMKSHLMIAGALFSRGTVCKKSNYYILAHLLGPCLQMVHPARFCLILDSKPIQLKPHGDIQNCLHFSSMPNTKKPVHS